jgi:hypothetical protein
MNKYLVETRHDREDCLHILDHFVAYGHITHFEWGCENGVCAGWAIIEAKDEKEAVLSVPSIVRSKTQVVKLSYFTPEKIQEFHKELSE